MTTHEHHSLHDSDAAAPAAQAESMNVHEASSKPDERSFDAAPVNVFDKRINVRTKAKDIEFKIPYSHTKESKRHKNLMRNRRESPESLSQDNVTV